MDEAREFDADHDEAKVSEPEDEYIQKNDDGSTTILFKYPVQPKDPKKDLIREIILKRPLVGDLESSDIAEGDVKKTIVIISSLSGLPSGVIRRIDLEDFKRVSGFLEESLGGGGKKKSPATGEE